MPVMLPTDSFCLTGKANPAIYGMVYHGLLIHYIPWPTSCHLLSKISNFHATFVCVYKFDNNIFGTKIKAHEYAIDVFIYGRKLYSKIAGEKPS